MVAHSFTAITCCLVWATMVPIANAFQSAATSLTATYGESSTGRALWASRLQRPTINDFGSDGDVSLVEDKRTSSSRRGFVSSLVVTASTVPFLGITAGGVEPAHAVGPIKISLEPTSYSAVICPPNRPIPGEKAMVGMRGLCVTVQAEMQNASPKDLEKVGVYGFVTDGESGDSVLANNPDGASDAGQFAMIESVTTKDTKVTFEFIAAVPREKDIAQYANGIGPLEFSSLRLISYPGGQQFGAISPCEYSEFSEECEAWEAENGPWKKAEYMVKSNPRTKGY